MIFKILSNRVLTLLQAVVLLSVILFGCTDKNSTNSLLTNGLPSSGGKTLEMLVVAEDKVYDQKLKDIIGNNFLLAQKGLPQDEPLFDVVHLRPENFIHSDMLQKHRNIIIIDYKAGNPNKIYQEISKRVYPQAVYKIMVDNKDSLYSLVLRSAPNMRQRFYDNEHIRLFNVFKRAENINLDSKIEKTFDFKLTISEDFYLAKEQKDFFWLRKETENESYNIMIHKCKYSSGNMFSGQNIVALRDMLAQKYIPGPTRGSYMGTEKRADIYTDTIKINNIVMIENRGLWRLFGDFMGGPFINYVFVNPKTQDFVMIDCFLYSPKKPKRDLLIQLESVVYGINKTIQK